MKFVSALLADSQHSLRLFLIRAALAGASVIAGAVGLCFATYALFEAWRLQYGVVNASIGLAAIYLVAAAVLFLCYRSAGRKPAANVRASAARLRSPDAPDPTQADPQAAALAMGVELAKQLTPIQLALIAGLSGFLTGRRL